MNSSRDVLYEYLRKQEDILFQPNLSVLCERLEFFCSAFDLVVALMESEETETSWKS